MRMMYSNFELVMTKFPKNWLLVRAKDDLAFQRSSIENLMNMMNVAETNI